MEDEVLSLEVIQELVKLGRESTGPKLIQGTTVPVVVVPKDCEVKAMPELVFHPHEPHEIQPKRIKGTVSVLDPESFVKYFSDFRNSDSRVFANEPEQAVVGIIDYHESADSKPHWCQHRVALKLQFSESWKAWTGMNNKRMTQQAFAEFLEQNSFDISAPSPGAILEVARDLQATTEVEFGGGVRANGHVNFRYSENTRGAVGAGQLAVPERFVINLPCFVGGVNVPMDVLLRYRLKEGHLEIWFTLVRPDDVRRQAFIGARVQIAESLKIDIINGQPA